MEVKMTKKFLVLISAALLFSSCGGGDIEKQKKYANSLKERGLYKQAADEFDRLSVSGKVSDSDIANLSYIIGSIYYDDIHDYENALKYFIRARVYDPDSGIKSHVNTKMIACLERLGKSLDAINELESATTINKRRQIPKTSVIAKIRDKEITMEDLDKQIKDLPAYMQENFKDNAKKLDFLKQYVATELMFDAAKRQGLDKDTEILGKTHQVTRSLMVQKLLEDKLKNKIKITESDLKNYYESHKKDFVEKDKDKKERQKSYDEAKESVKQAVMYEKQQDVYSEYVTELIKAEKVEIYESMFKPVVR
jgi:peptidyl-prolyl cis-trans isomerase C